MNELKEQLEKSIKLAKYRLKQFDDEKLATEEGNIEYNRLLVRKAVMLKNLETKEENSLKLFAQKIMRKAKGKTLICDHF